MAMRQSPDKATTSATISMWKNTPKFLIYESKRKKYVKYNGDMKYLIESKLAEEKGNMHALVCNFLSHYLSMLCYCSFFYYNNVINNKILYCRLNNFLQCELK